MALFFKIIAIACLSVLATVSAYAEDAEQPDEKPRSLKIKGLGILGDRLMLNHVENLLQEDEEENAVYFRPAEVEDALFVMESRMEKQSYLEASYKVKLELMDGTERKLEWEPGHALPLEPGMQVRKLRVDIDPGPLFAYESLKFEGVSEEEGKTLVRFFYAQSLLGERRSYTSGGLRKGVNSIVDELRTQGYADASATVLSNEVDRETGKVNAVIEVTKGPRFFVRKTTGTIDSESLPDTLREEILRRTNKEFGQEQPYSQAWFQDWRQDALARLFEEGYPRARATHEVTRDPQDEEMVYVDIALTIEPRKRYKTGDITFIGIDKTKESILKRRIRLRDGDWFNRLEVENARFRFVRLGIFDDVRLKYDLDDEERDVVHVNYEMQESETLDMSLLFGYGSYEQLRGGIEVRRNNIWGRAHSSQFRFVQSFKSTSAQYDYHVPELFGAFLDGNAQLSYLHREEVSFTREEWGLTTGLTTYLRGADLDVGLTYRIGQINSSDIKTTVGARAENARVSAVGFSLSRDRRDNPIYPEKGYRFRLRPEVATQYVASEVDYYKLQLDGSYHLPLGNNFVFHTGMTTGMAHSMHSDKDDLPFSERFFLGGENTIRGYLEGEASPVDGNEEFIGAELYGLLNLEFETKLSRSLSVIVFSDTLWQAVRFDDPDDSEVLSTLGLGLRFKTPLGPLRLEYGHNMTPRSFDSSGVLHFSLGFPF